MYRIQKARSELVSANLLQKLSQDYLHIVEHYYCENPKMSNSYIICDLCLEWLECYFDNEDKHEFINNSYPDNNRIFVEKILRDVTGDVIRDGAETLKTRVKRYFADKGLWWYYGEFNDKEDLPDDYDFKI